MNRFCCRASIRAVTGLVLTVLFVCKPLPARQNDTDKRISDYQTRAKLFANDYSIYDGLGEAYLQKGRESGDAAYYQLAEKALQKSLDLVTDDLAAASPTTHMAMVYMGEHQFRDALDWAERASALGSGDATAYGIAGDALADLGEYDTSAEMYARLADAGNAKESELGYAFESRTSYLKFIEGKTTEAIARMVHAIDLARTVHLPRENQAWLYYQLGEEYFLVGKLQHAEESYRQSLELFPTFYRALAGEGKVCAATNRWQEAIAYYQRAISVVPFLEYVAELGDVYAQSGNIEEAKKQYGLVEYIVRLSELNKVLYNRELALYYADHDIKLKESLELAQKELQQRQDVHTWDVLAWAYFKNRQTEEAKEAIQHALAKGTKDPLFFFHAGMIYYRAGDYEKARQFLGLALAVNPHFHIRYGDVAKSALAQLDERPAPLGIPEESGDGL